MATYISGLYYYEVTSIKGYNLILVVYDRFPKISYFIVITEK